MRWELSFEQQEFHEAFTGWLDHVADSPSVREWATHGGAPFEARLAEDGWLAAGLAEAAGGAGGGLVELALASEAMGSHGAPSAAWLSTMAVLPAVAGRPEVIEGLVERGEFVVWVGASDRIPGGGRALPLVDGTVTGEVRLVLGGSRAARFVVPVATGGGVGLALVEAADVQRGERSLLDQTREACDVRFDGAPAQVLDVDAEAILTQVARRAAVLVSADSLGAAARMLDLAVEYSKQRQQFGVPIGSFQAVKHAAATILVGVEAARSIIYPAAAAVDEGHEMAEPWACAAKAQVTKSGVAAADSALTMHGAIGYTWEHDLHLYYKRAKLDARLFGAPSAWNERLASQLELTPQS
ncbi:acyl-CoA dehydrogenase family protein [Kribbia dieselivorans]|uniref:acyl-CoA dehydrogenase family protein n=1 Tax=Kribbia dieselivorans TaxID=331526 RepID=UPI0008389F2F|nr:acyl-CoA dehydrogenase family protein [Kribbia dieselivorans]